RMKAKEKQIDIESVKFLTIDGNYLNPAKGTTDGGEEIILEDYTGNSTDLVFLDDPQIKFNCTMGVMSLHCMTPKIPKFLNHIIPFKSYKLTIDDEILQIKYVLYGKFLIFGNFLNFY